EPPGKGEGEAAFQAGAGENPRDGPRGNRRRFNGAGLGPGHEHRFTDRFAGGVGEEADRMLRSADADGGGELDWDRWQRAVRRITRRVVFGDGAADDESLTELLGELMDEANGMPGEPSKRLPELMERIHGYGEAGAGGSVV